MGLNEEIWNTINKYQTYHSVYMEENGNEYSLGEELIGIFDNWHMIQYAVDVFETFDSPGGAVYAVAVAYIKENGELEMITEVID